MKKALKILGLLTVLSLSFLVSACPKQTNIGTIEANPSRYLDKEVGVVGTVRSSFGLSIPIVSNGTGGIYKVEDGTGSIWVMTQKSVPSKGARVGVKGKLQNGVNFNGKNYGLVIIESDRRFKDDR